MSQKLDQAAGVVTISLGWLTAVLTPKDAAAWGEVIMSLAPLILIGFLLWRVRVLDKHLAACRKDHQATTEKLLIAFTALKDPSVANRLPEAAELIQGNYNLKDCLGECKLPGD